MVQDTIENTSMVHSKGSNQVIQCQRFISKGFNEKVHLSKGQVIRKLIYNSFKTWLSS